MEFMREGGFGMWLMLATTVIVGGFAATRASGARSRVLAAGTIAILLQAMLATGTNLEAVAAHYSQFPNPTEALGIGLGEAANAAWFGSLLAAVLGIAALVTGRGENVRHA